MIRRSFNVSSIITPRRINIGSAAQQIRAAPQGVVRVDTGGKQGLPGRDGIDGEAGGPPGPEGPPGPRGKDGQIRFTGFGPPNVIVGAEPGDTYMDLATGDIFKLT